MLSSGRDVLSMKLVFGKFFLVTRKFPGRHVPVFVSQGK
jgi:hypothetical protein